MRPVKEKITSINFDFISNLYFLLVWVILPVTALSSLPEPLELAKVMVFIVATFIFFGYMAGSIGHPIAHVKYKSIFLTLIALVLIEAYSSLIGQRPITSFLGLTYRYQGVITQITYFLFSWVVCVNAVRNGKIIPRAIMYGSILLSFLTIVEAVAFGSARATGLLGNPNFTGGFLAMSLPFVGNIYLWPILLAGIFVTGSRSAMIAAGVILLITAATRIGSKKVAYILIAVLLASGIFVFPKRERSVFDDRVIIWTKAVAAISQKPLLGWGLENFELAFGSEIKADEFHLKNIRVDKAHNELLEVAVGSGLLGLSLYLCLVIQTVVVLWRGRKDNLSRSVLLGLLGFLIISNLNVVNINEYLFFYLALGVAASGMERQKKSNPIRH